MGNKKISDFTASAAPAAADLMEIETAGGNSRKVTIANLKARGALVKKAADQTGANYTAGAAIAWDSETGGYDTDSIHDNATNNSRLTVPSGVTCVRISAGVSLNNHTANKYCAIYTKKNGSLSFLGHTEAYQQVNVPYPSLNVSSPIMPVTAGDYFEVWLLAETDTSIDITAASSWFAMEIIA